MTQIYLSDMPCLWHTHTCCSEYKLHLIFYCASLWFGLGKLLGSLEQALNQGQTVWSLSCFNKTNFETPFCIMYSFVWNPFWMKLSLYLMPWISESLCFCFVIKLLVGRMNAGTLAHCLFSQFYTSLKMWI